MPYIDFHAHVAPGIDHGSADLDHSLAQLDAARLAGVGVIVASSHFYMSDGISPAEFVAARDRALHELRGALQDEASSNEASLNEASSNGPRLIPAAEVHLSPGMAELEGLELLCIGGTDMILIEMPYGVPDPWSYDELMAITERGLHIVVAHIDRCPRRCADNLLQLGLDMQVNADAVCSFLGFRRILPYLRSGAVKALGSDVHTEPERSYKLFARAVKKLEKFNLPLLDTGGAEAMNLK